MNIENPDKLEKILYNILEFYKKKYTKLKNIYITFGCDYGCNFNWSDDDYYINMDFCYVEDTFFTTDRIIRHGNNLTPENYAIIILLHEIKHCIDFLYSQEEYISEMRKQRDMEANTKEKYRNLPLEKKADRFANMEFKKLEIVKC